jgi:phage/plasmid-associated DNA primase
MQSFFSFDGLRYVEVPKETIMGKFEATYPDISNNKNNSELIGALQRKCGITDELFRKSTDGYINFKNGHFNKATGNIEPRSASRYFLYCLPFDHEAKATAPAWDAFLDQCFMDRDSGLVDSECKRVLEEYIGYTLSGDPNVYEKMLLAVGMSGANGKGTIWNVVRYLIGEGGYSALNVRMLANPKEREMIDGKLANLSGEESLHAFIQHEAELKSMTSRDAIPIRPIWKRAYTMVNRAKLWMACNEVPTAHDNSGGWHRRFIILRFNNKAVDKADLEKEQAEYTHGLVYAKDVHLDSRLVAEAAGIFNRAWEAYAQAKLRGALTSPASSKAEIQETSLGDPLEEVLNHLFKQGTKDDVVWTLDLTKKVLGELTLLGIHSQPSPKRIIQNVKRMFKVQTTRTMHQRGIVGLAFRDVQPPEYS